MAATPYTVYYAMDSLCSFMLRYSLAIRGPGKDGVNITMDEKLVDIHYKREQLSEQFLLRVNPKGQVPALSSPALKNPMPDSTDITNYFATMFPTLKPAGYEGQIDEMLAKMHALPFFTLSFGGHNAAAVPQGTVDAMKKMLREDHLTDEHRKAVEKKLAMQSRADLSAVLGREAVMKAEETIHSFLRYVDERLPSSQGWLFGLPQPSAADGHLVALLVRIHDVGRDYLFPERVKDYKDRTQATAEWQKVMGGLTTTMCPG